MRQQLHIYLEEAQLILENDFSADKAQRVAHIYREAIQQFPHESAEPYIRLSYFAYKAQLFEECLILLKAALKVEPFNMVAQKLYQQIKALKEKRAPAPQAAARHHGM